MHVPAERVVTVGPATVHTGGVSELNDTGSSDDAAANRVTDAPTVTLGGCANLIVCGIGVVVPGTLTEAVSQAFCTFADGLVSW